MVLCCLFSKHAIYFLELNWKEGRATNVTINRQTEMRGVGSEMTCHKIRVSMDWDQAVKLYMLLGFKMMENQLTSQTWQYMYLKFLAPLNLSNCLFLNTMHCMHNAINKQIQWHTRQYSRGLKLSTMEKFHLNHEKHNLISDCLVTTTQVYVNLDETLSSV